MIKELNNQEFTKLIMQQGDFNTTAVEIDDNDVILTGEFRLNENSARLLNLKKSKLDKQYNIYEVMLYKNVDYTTKLDLIVITIDKRVYHETKASIDDIDFLHDLERVLCIYVQNEDGTIGELIWKDGELID